MGTAAGFDSETQMSQASAALLATQPAESPCERCTWIRRRDRKRTLEEAASPAQHEAATPSETPTCLFCQDTDGNAYVPVHFSAAHGSPRVSTARGSSRDEEAARLVVATSEQSSVAEFSQSLHGHRGCKDCWSRWEAQGAKTAAAAGSSTSWTVHCPVCDLPVDIRQSYDEALCKPCQREVVARGVSWGLLRARFEVQMMKVQKLLGICVLCLLLGIQAMVSMLIWELCAHQIEAGLNSAPTGHVQVPKVMSSASSLSPQSNHSSGHADGVLAAMAAAVADLLMR
ncbi:unnamed protein product [Polarella glacialis]|uniref:Uncharacterized protein n=1 Tax=Polarella glacialis TaxID=89957 RepID=A0A813HDN5_POLGL|nr:unnamed protein product [Polarella glacialis]